MTLTLEKRVEVLEDKVEALETGAGPGRADAQSENLADLRRRFATFREVQAKQSQTLDIHTGKFNGLSRSASSVQFDVGVLGTDLKELKEEVSGKLERLDSDVTWLKGTAGRQEGLIVALSQDVVSLKDEITGLRTDVNRRFDGVDSRLDRLETDVAGIRNDLAEFKVEVKGTLAEILDRLPARAA